MAARKSCTHLTWADAKSKAAGPGVFKKKGEKPKKLNQTEKLIAKSSVPPDEQRRHKAAMKSQRRQEEKLIAVAEKKNAERRMQFEKGDIKPLAEARERQKKKMETLYHAETLPLVTTKSSELDADMTCQCKEMHLCEAAALEAMFVDSADFRVCEASRRETLEEALGSGENEVILDHPPMSFLLQLEIRDEERTLSEVELVALLSLQVTLPATYPLLEDDDSSVPRVDIILFECYDEDLKVNADKPYESMAYLDKSSFLEALQQQLRSILPDFAIYEACVTWVKEHLFEYCELSARV